MIIYQCQECNKSFLNGVDLAYHLENYHGQTLFSQEKKCPQCSNEKVVFLAKTFDRGKEKFNFYYCSQCKKALKVEFS